MDVKPVLENQQHGFVFGTSKSSISVTHRLPPEMLQKIFHNHHSASEDSASKVPLKRALLLAAICQHWRNVALEMPELWQCLTFHIGDSEDTTKVDSPYTVWLSRTTPSYPVHLHIINTCVEMMPEDWHPKVSEFLYTNRSILHSITITEFSAVLEDGNDFLEDIFVPPTAVDETLYPLLRSLSVSFDADGEADYGEIDQGVCHAPATAHAPWSQMTYLCIEQYLPASEASAMLALCINIEHCDIWIVQDIPPSVPPTSRILPALHTLIIEVFDRRGRDGFNRHSHFFDAITCPALKALRLDMGLCFEDLGEHYMDFKTRSSLDLESASINDAEHNVTSNRLVEFLSGMPSLLEISFSNTYAFASQEFLTALTFRPGQILNLAPYLRELDINLEPIDIHGGLLIEPPNYSDTPLVDMLMDMVESRCPPPVNLEGVEEPTDRAYLQRATFHMAEDSDDEWQDNQESLRVNEWTARGLDISFT